eukprot:13674919-Alexandrium_andersonii.AAC.1
MQFVYGVSLRLPFELLSDEAHDLVGHEVLGMDGAHLQGVEAEFARAQAVRRKATEAAMAVDARG